ncbi:hypothetical protein ACIBCA_10500 [Kitasatospora sp. NPDC051170]|uniref:hypothetical protein n=1 Tax=Kitasatospora sp. NPDC051170 TaxID=3364056 RepID=UPI00379B95AF
MSTEPRSETVNVAAYWRGDFTLTPEAPSEKEDDTPAPRRLGRSGITAHGRDLATLLLPAYEALKS